MTACIFDLDGTLLNTLEDLACATNQALSDYHFPTHDLATIQSYVGGGVGRLVWRAAPEDTPQDTLDHLLARFLEVYQQEMTRRTRPYPGIEDLLETLQLSGLPLGVFSNKTHPATQALCDHFFPDVFQGVLGHRAPTPLKPAPDGLYALLTEMGVAREDCLYLGDSLVDIQLGQQADVPVLACGWGFAGKQALQNSGGLAVVSVPEEALPYILSPSSMKG